MIVQTHNATTCRVRSGSVRAQNASFRARIWVETMLRNYLGQTFEKKLKFWGHE